MSSQTALPLAICKSTHENTLIVEGKNDCHGIYQIAARHGLQDFFGIWDGGGDKGALSRFGGLLTSSKQRPAILGIVLDCDADDTGLIQGPDGRWAQIRHRFADLPYEIPAAPSSAGTIIEAPAGYPKIGVRLMPDNVAEGMFEDFLLPLISQDARAYAEHAASDAKVQGFASFKDVHLSKAIAHTFLAWQDEPGKPIGVAIKSRLFDIDGPEAAPFVNWLRELFHP